MYMYIYTQIDRVIIKNNPNKDLDICMHECVCVCMHDCMYV